MGVPKFYRWISERYPCLSEVVKEYQIPEFDNLYLDMNGIVHVCSHPEDDNPHFRITEEKIFQDIFHYIEVLFRMIKPKKVFFMAIDGVAPRAKMNQQRGRRFRSAREAEMLVRKALEKGETLPSEERFDSNCITPGTEFMVKLQEQLKYFVVNKISNDKLWQGPRIFLSGHETPGEGEHKVMDFIRYERSMPNYDPNTRHCLYGLDADLMMLGLSSHEPHFSLLREEVRFGGKNSQKRSTAPEETVFHLLHLSLFREYLDYEFSVLKGKLPYGYDLERIIDDWILMGFLVGNDFIPHLPNLHIHHDALPLLWKTYKQVMPTLDGYLHDGGTLNLSRFEKYMTKLSEYDVETFADNFADLKWLEGKTESKAAKDEANARRRRGKASVSSNDTGIPTANEFMILKNSDDGDDDDLRAAMGAITLEEFEEDEDDFIAADSEAMQADFREHKDAYYLNKMNLGASREMLRSQAEGYVKALQWILHYYFNGVPSWSWFYPHHYAPYLSDVKDFANMKMNFDMATPFMPFQQLMAVLPAASKNLLPKALQPLMISESSPVIDFYPQEFDLDLNGKMQEWEAVVLIPFIEEKRLISAMKPLEEKMNNAEKLRNRHSEHILYQYDPKSQGTYKSSLPGKFPDIYNHHSLITCIDKDEFRIAPDKIKKGLCKGMTGEVYFPGFPTLKHLPHKFHLAKTGVKVFQMNSRGENMILSLHNRDIVDIEQVAREYIGRSIYVAWPHLTESKVIAVADCNEKYTLKEGSLRRRGHKGREEEPIEIDRVNMDRDDSKIWCKEVHGLTDVYKDRKGVEIGDTDIVVYAVPMVGRKYVQGVRGVITLEKQWGIRPVPHAFQATVKDIVVKDPTYKQFRTLDELFPSGTEVFMLGQPYYGCMGEVMEIDQKNEGRIRVNFTKHQEPNMDYLIKKKGQYETRYHNSYHAGKRVGVSSFLISRMTGVLYVAPGSKEKPPASGNKRTNVALNLKFNKSEKEVPGYTRKSDLDNQWQYSEKLLQILGEYIQKFPEVFEYIAKSNEENYYEDDIFGEDNSAEKMKEIKDYIKSLPCSSVAPANFGTLVLDDSVVSVIESNVSRAAENNKKRKRIKMQVKPHLLYRPLDAQSHLIPDPTTTYELFDRVVNVREGYSIPVGLRGTVIGIGAEPKEQDQLYEVVFDEEFLGGLTIRCSPNRGYRVPASALINLTHGVRKEEARNFKPTAVVKPLPGQDFMTPNLWSGGSNVSNMNWRANQPPHQFQQQQFQQQPRYNNYQGNNQQQSPPDFYPQWKSQPGTSSASSYQQLKQQGSQMGQQGSYQQFQQQHKNQQPFNPIFSGTKQQQYPQGRYVDQHQQRPKNHVSPPNVQYSQQTSQPTKDSNAFANVWSQLQGGSNNIPSTWNNKPEIPHSHQHTQHQQPQISPNVPTLDDAAKALHSSKISPSSSAVSQQQYNQTGNNNKNNNPRGQKKLSPQQYPYPVEGPADLFAVPPPDLPKLDLTHLFSVPPPPLPGGVPLGQKQQQHPGPPEADDFNRLMAALHSDTSGMPYTSPHSTAKEGTQALQQILKVNKTEETPPGQQHSGKQYGKQLSVQELFQAGASDKPSEAVQQVNTQQKRTPQKQIAQQEAQRKRNPVGELLTYCTSMGMLAPRYDYTPAGDGRLFCLVTLPNGEQYKGSYAKDRRQAMDSAAKNALTNLQQQQQQPGFQRNMPGIFGGQGVSRPDQHQEEEDTHGNFAASPNSAFTPFKGKDPFEIDMEDQRNHYGQPFPNPPKQPNFQSPPQAFIHTKHGPPPHGHVIHQEHMNSNYHMMHSKDHGHNYHIQQNPGYNVYHPDQVQNQVAGRDINGSANQAGHDHQQNKPRRDSESETKRDNPFVPLQVMKKQKTPAKSEKKNNNQEDSKSSQENPNLQQDNTVSEPNSTNEPKNSTVEESNSNTSVMCKKQIKFTDPVKETKSPRCKEKKADGSKASKGESNTGQTQPKRPRSRIAAKFN